MSRYLPFTNGIQSLVRRFRVSYLVVGSAQKPIGEERELRSEI
ncbi:hypothetical protein CCACVL1_01182 [Corchorus capsularis]|uniref:Uncharacterized protein n=1 Tax=Corchorus capsularis TaxID=210143 RepID=A0A1R3HGM1_COCAP|nr:hypothetical protein CCACVL1_19510 [Corchorus capsularis]OMP07986.1 hypothetical protein CCACVL1_01182 [Corchorus capsularis]